MKKYHTYPKDLTGLQFGYLTVIKRDRTAPPGRTKWWCRCHCGRVVSVFRNNLTHHDNTQSCGCFRQFRAHQTHSTHGKTHRSEAYRIWIDLRHRRKRHGIQVDLCWDEFTTFLKHMGEPTKPCLCKIDPSYPYAPCNCFWGEHEEIGWGKILPKW